MLHVFEYGDESQKYLLDDINALRRRVYVRDLERKRASLTEYGKDAFDRPGTYYAAWLNKEGRLVGSWRMMPTFGPHMLRDVFPQLLGKRPTPASPDLWEMSQFVLDRDEGRHDCLVGLHALIEAALSFCECRNINAVMMVHDCVRARYIRQALKVKPIWQSPSSCVGNIECRAALYASHSRALHGRFHRGSYGHAA